jgi:uncharacterized protein (TIGR01777 family)
MHVLVSGSTGLIGSRLVRALTDAGDRVTRLVRPGTRTAAPDSGARVWDPPAGRLDTVDLEGFDAVVHLAGENIASGLWTAARKRRIRSSRVDSTALLAQTLARLTAPPPVFVCASAVGYYGSRGEETLREDSAPGAGFLAEVCRAWEAATGPAARRGIRVVNTRFGIVLSGAGGPLAKMLPIFRLGLGGRIGSGAQYMSWVALEDVAAALVHVLATERLAGPVNVVAPAPVTNREFTETLGRLLGRPTFFAVPASAARFLLGEMGEELLLVSQRAVPDRLTAAGFGFRYPSLEAALRAALARPR